jgi:hypothetical protein
MELSRRENNNRKVSPRQALIREARAPRLVSELLTLREACERFPGLHFKQIYVWAEAGILHPVKPQGRTLYPEWELAEAVRKLTGPYGLFRARRAATLGLISLHFVPAVSALAPVTVPAVIHNFNPNPAPSEGWHGQNLGGGNYSP